LGGENNNNNNNNNNNTIIKVAYFRLEQGMGTYIMMGAHRNNNENNPTQRSIGPHKTTEEHGRHRTR
jgi:hypothetical protein